MFLLVSKAVTGRARTPHGGVGDDVTLPSRQRGGGPATRPHAVASVAEAEETSQRSSVQGEQALVRPPGRTAMPVTPFTAVIPAGHETPTTSARINGPMTPT